MTSNKLDPTQAFSIFVLEAYKAQLKKTGIEALEDFIQHDVFRYLEEGYEVLHTQSIAFVVNEVIELIKNK